jgi:uncharacterized protein (TIGR03435 family)
MPVRLSALYCFVTIGAPCQPAPDYTHFEVAAVKPSTRPPTLPAGAVPAPLSDGGPGSTNPEQIRYRYYSLRTLILIAYDIRSMQLDAPKGMTSDLFDITATLPAGTKKEQLRTMFQNLLAERFKLKLHHETRPLPVYAMTVGKNGLKLKESSTEPASPVPPGTSIGGPDEEGFPRLPPGYAGAVAIPSSGRLRITGQKLTLAQLAQQVESRLDHPIVDQTGLTGLYDFKLEIEWMARPGTSTDPSDVAPSVPQALDKLGLKLESKQLPFDVIVVDQFDKVPTEN